MKLWKKHKKYSDNQGHFVERDNLKSTRGCGLSTEWNSTSTFTDSILYKALMFYRTWQFRHEMWFGFIHMSRWSTPVNWKVFVLYPVVSNGQWPWWLVGTWWPHAQTVMTSVANAAVYPPNWATLKWPAAGQKNCWAGDLKLGYFSFVCPRQLFFFKCANFLSIQRVLGPYQCPRTFLSSISGIKTS